MNVTELKEKLLTSLELWADARISDMVKKTPALAIPSVYMKRASHNIIAKNKDKWGKSIDNATLFIADEDGNIDTDTIFSDLMQMLENISDYEFDLGFIKGRIDDGVIAIDLPDNIVTTILFGSKKSISFAKEDFEEFKNLLTAES
ncbi:hypothetical protein [Segatella copri]|jgi:hypothetical protein|uniref:hypothetical protein n=1 Tax=Segatella copri TaxID=165179 RepID=UPI0020CE1289|nr:hypothetical protein [Segatella copri]MCP9457400.1 hypothetical protein [Segatella copri]MCP9515718.1 hypothetical protein [Segatella copri]MCP9518927.1 hypothetical protein [Segatella copri]MCP9529973.1 hypothetical protein [Segatella copri]MCP9531537.1 hypothetical protein [Segatella copri]